MGLASNSRKQVAYTPETTIGVTPTVSAAFLRVTDETLEFNQKYENSKQIRADRQTVDTVPVDASVAGAIPFELSYKEFDTLMAAALQGAWVQYGTNGKGAAVALTLNSTTNTITAGTAPTGNDAFTTLACGQWLMLRAPSDAADMAIVQVHGTTAPTSTVITLDAGTVLPGTGSRAAVAACVISSSRVANGTTQTSFSIESQLTDVGQFFLYKGLVISKMALNFASGSIVTGTFDFMGTGAARAASTGLAASPTASQTYGLINAVTGFGTLLEGGVALSGTFIKDLKLEVDNTLREQKAVGILGSANIASGHVAVKGSMSVYLSNGALYDKFLNNTGTSLVWHVSDTTGNGYAFTIPYVKYTAVKRTGGNSDTDVMLDITYEGFLDTTTGKMALLGRFGA